MIRLLRENIPSAAHRLTDAAMADERGDNQDNLVKSINNEWPAYVTFVNR